MVRSDPVRPRGDLGARPAPESTAKPQDPQEKSSVSDDLDYNGEARDEDRDGSERSEILEEERHGWSLRFLMFLFCSFLRRESTGLGATAAAR
jgi:hypothetical protein